jgi:hypothetical protein
VLVAPGSQGPDLLPHQLQLHALEVALQDRRALLAHHGPGHPAVALGVLEQLPAEGEGGLGGGAAPQGLALALA